MDKMEGKKNIRLKLALLAAPGGVYSQFLQLLYGISRLEDMGDVYYELPFVGVFNKWWNLKQIENTRIPVHETDNPLDWVFDQHYDDSYTLIDVLDGCGEKICDPIQESSNYDLWKTRIKQIKIKNHIMDTVNEFCANNINSHTLGVHVRTSDMNLTHPEYGIFTTDDYILKIREIIKTEEITNIFVASDNYFSINAIQEEFKNTVYFNCKLRQKSDVGWYGETSINIAHKNDPLLWEEAFIECLILSRCNKLLHRYSGFANAAIIFSDTITQIYRL